MKKFFALISGMLMALLISGCSTDKERADTHIDNAESFLAKQNYYSAADSYRQAVAEDPDSVEAWVGLARACIQLGDTKGAADAYKRIIGIDPGNAEAVLSLARFDMLSGNTTLAEQRISRVLKDMPENIEALFLMADLYSRTSRFTQAEKIYERILPITPDKAKALTGLAQIQAHTGNLTGALKSLENAMAAAPDAVEPRLMLFNYYYGQGDYPNAEKALLGLVSANPSNPALRILLGKFYYNRNQPDDAEAAFLEAVKQDPDRITAYLMAGKFYSVTDKPADALQMFEKAGQLRPQDVKVSTLLAEFYLDHDFLPDARRTIAGILEQHPGYFPARLLNVRSLLAEKNYDQAIMLCDAYLKSNPGADHLLVYKGMAHVENGDLELAEKVLAEAVQVAPANMNAKFRLLDVYLKKGWVEQAQELNREIFGYLHKNFDVTVVLGDTALHKEKSQKGLDSLDSLSRFASANPFESFRAEHKEKLESEYDRLMGEFNQIIEKKPELISVFENVILMHAVRKEYDLALNRCDQQIERLKNNPVLAAKIYNIKGGLYLAQNNIAQAEKAFKHAITKAPDFLKPYYGLGKIYIINKDIDSAVIQYKALLERDPKQPVPYLLLGVLSKMEGDFSSAEEYYRKSLMLNPNFVQAANNLAYLLISQGKNMEEALSLALRAKTLKPDDPYVLDTLGWVYFQKGAFDDAVRELTRTVNMLPDSIVGNYHLGMAYYQKGEAVLARQYLEKALQFDGNFAEADEVRRILLDLK